jgi:hypothetical protein
MGQLPPVQSTKLGFMEAIAEKRQDLNPIENLWPLKLQLTNVPHPT